MSRITILQNRRRLIARQNATEKKPAARARARGKAGTVEIPSWRELCKLDAKQAHALAAAAGLKIKPDVDRMDCLTALNRARS